MSSVDKDNLIWTVAETKDMFQEHRLWPSFVGTNFDQERRASKGRLPVMIWPEQRRYLNERKEASQNAERGSSLKRKRDATAPAIPNDEVSDDGSALKKVKNFSIMDSFSGLANKAAAALNMAFSVLFGWKSTTSSELVANVRQESDESIESPVQDFENISTTEESTTHSSAFATDAISGGRTDGINIGGSKTEILGKSEDNKNSSGSSAINGILNTGQSSPSSSSVMISVLNADAMIVPQCSSQYLSAEAKRKTISRKVSDHKQIAAEVQMTIFRSLQEYHGYFVGPGDVYGGDYTIYRGGDPSNSHSTATVRVVRQRKISARDLLSFSRVQNQVAKSAVLGFIDPATKDAAFLVVNFQNVSDRA